MQKDKTPPDTNPRKPKPLNTYKTILKGREILNISNNKSCILLSFLNIIIKTFIKQRLPIENS